MSTMKGRLPTPVLASKRSLLVHPLIIATGLWGVLMVLYALHLSYLLWFSILDLLPLALAIWTPFPLVALGFALWRPRPLRRRYKLAAPTREQMVVIETRIRFLWCFWIVAAVFETTVSGGFPIIWIFTNAAKTYFDYGLASLHGLVNSLLLALTLCRVGLYLLTGEGRHLRLPFFSIIWWIALVTRGTLFFSLVACSILLLLIRPVRTKTIGRMVAYAILTVLLFGWVGDQRSGADSFRELAQPTSHYPQWLPSGILWVYIYATTPLNNLAYSMVSRKPEENLLLPHTLSILLPTVIRNYVYGDAGVAAEEINGDLVESHFNVSTAYSGPAQDFGLLAVFFFSLITAGACQWFWYKPDLRSQLIFAVLAQCLVFSVFYNLFLSLPMIAQIGWFAFILRRKSNNINPNQGPRSSLSAAVQPAQ